jgi:hypothetical protein
MRIEVIKSKHIEAFFDNETRIFSTEYLPETENMTNKEWHELMKVLATNIEKYKPWFIIDNNMEMRFNYSPDMQIWSLILFVNSWNKIGLKKYVQILPIGIVGQLTTQQAEELAVNKFEMEFEHKIVDNYSKALKWINE